VGKREEKRSLGRPIQRWVDNIKMVLGEIRRGGVDWIDVVHDVHQCSALVNMVRNLHVPQNTGKFSGNCMS
jgi:hypothetical protein